MTTARKSSLACRKRGEVTRAIAGRSILYAYSPAKNGDIAAQIDMPERPAEIYFQSASTNKPIRLTKTNDAIITQLKLVQPEYIQFKSKDGTAVHGYLYKPLDYTPGKKYPTILRPMADPSGLLRRVHPLSAALRRQRLRRPSP